MDSNRKGVDVDYIRERIKELLKIKGISAVKMSMDLGNSRSYIFNITSGRTLPSMTELFKIIQYFEIDIRDFFDAGVENPLLLNEVMTEIRNLNNDELNMILHVLNVLKSSKAKA